MPFSKEQLERYSRHFVLKEIGMAGQKKLAASRVLVIGAGGLGSPSLWYLAAAGVGTIGVADGDCVERSNLNRQIIHRTDSLGMPKAESAARSIRDYNPDVSVRTYNGLITPDNIAETIADYDFVIDATDSFEAKLLINDACVLGTKPFSHAGIVRFEGQVMTWVPGAQEPCVRCIFGDVPDRSTVRNCSQVGVLGAAIGVLGSIQAVEAVKYLLDLDGLLTGRMLFFDGLSMTFTEARMAARNPACRVCGPQADITDLRKNAAEYAPRECGL